MATPAAAWPARWRAAPGPLISCVNEINGAPRAARAAAVAATGGRVDEGRGLFVRLLEARCCWAPKPRAGGQFGPAVCPALAGAAANTPLDRRLIKPAGWNARAGLRLRDNGQWPMSLNGGGGGGLATSRLAPTRNEMRGGNPARGGQINRNQRSFRGPRPRRWPVERGIGPGAQWPAPRRSDINFGLTPLLTARR